MSRRKLFSIAPDAPFLEVLVARVLDGTLLGDWPRTGPFWLADVTIVLPTSRARLQLASLFAQALGGAALLPDIRIFGGDSAEEEPFLPPFERAAIAPAASLLERRLMLARLVEKFITAAGGFASPPNAAETLWLADELAKALDDLEIEDVPLAALRGLDVGELAANWQQTLKFLDVVFEQWPAILAERGKIDAAAARNQRLRRQAETAALLYGARPVIAAGSTGSIPATAALLKAIAGLERGAIVLPGLDLTLSATEHAGLLDESANPHGHPQYGLAKLLRRLGAAIADVSELAAGPRAPRTMVVQKALALAETTAQWTSTRREMGAGVLDAAMAGFAIVAAPNADLEARAIALAARQALGDGESVGIISPDRDLARRIAIELGRFDIEIDDAAGTPLYQTSAGRFARLVLAAVSENFAPVALMALLRNRATMLGLTRAALARRADRIELCLLRGQRAAPGIAGLRALVELNAAGKAGRAPRLSEDDVSDVHDVLDRLERATATLCAALAGRLNAAGLAAGLSEAIGALLATAEGEDAALPPGYDEFVGWAAELSVLAGDAAPIAPINLDGVLRGLMAGISVRRRTRRRDDISIWGALEARLQSPDLMILAGVNEDIWPAPADPGPWLSRKMRIAVGLEPPERQQGQAAHDFAMALGNANLLVAYAERMGTAPALPSRFVQRLDAFLGDERARALRARGAVWLAKARALDRVAGRPLPAMRPLPMPPAEMRPRQLSVTEIETLMRSPYDVYAKHMLRLRPLDPLGMAPDARERGSMIHAVFARFVEEGHDFAATDAAAKLLAMATEEFAGLDAIGERRDIWLRRFVRAAEKFLDFERERKIGARYAERDGQMVFPALKNFVLVGRADRLDVLGDGTREIIDFKTGSLPAPKAMSSFEAPQLLLEAAMARAGAFADVAPGEVSALTYIKIGLGPKAFTPRAFALPDGYSLADAADEVLRRMQGHVDALLLRDDLPMAARILPDVNRRYRGDYDHLARTDEWTLAAGDEEL